MTDPASQQTLSIRDGLRFDKALAFVWRAAPRHTILGTCLLIVQGLVPVATIYVFKLIVDHIAVRPVNVVSLQYSEHLLKPTLTKPQSFAYAQVGA